jgi:hypothetical protein
MRQRTWATLDDFDGTPAAETVVFTVDGTRYEMDLSAENAAEWRDLIGVYVAVARRVPVPRTKRAGKGPKAADVRAWAAVEGVEVKPTGAIPAAVLTAYANRSR